ncbi:N-acetyltransferase [Ktedonosporobacter rubrisoli]|uniref:N-acetyltransferase n=1 Tax=Ktedonosporobacter rubrisoli TaxID=2509675 RepID=A0A4P6JXN7_KTERU|nr:GNAT family protein [Ktedonosporobacter rubrisoli]QBD80414.1 N-acetyltransferase [Ktedonosporobacter rubrisoli]
MILSTDRLILREFERDDWQDVFAYQVDPLYLRYVPWTNRTEQDVRAFVQTFINWRDERPRRKFQFAIVLREEGRLIGNCGIRMNTASARMADIGYELDSRYWGRGYATEAARALLTFGFDKLALHRIWAECIAENTGSAHVLEKIGMHNEGHLHQNEWMKNRWWDTLLYAILDSEWLALQRSHQT